MALFAQYAMASTEEALEDAGWKPTAFEEREATVSTVEMLTCLVGWLTVQGICLGSGIGNFDEVYDTVVAYDKGVRCVSRQDLNFRLTRAGLQKDFAAVCSEAADQSRGRAYIYEIRVYGRFKPLDDWFWFSLF